MTRDAASASASKGALASMQGTPIACNISLLSLYVCADAGLLCRWYDWDIMLDFFASNASEFRVAVLSFSFSLPPEDPRRSSQSLPSSIMSWN